MNEVYKKISLGPSISRTPGLTPFVGQEGTLLPNSGNWGKYPYAINFRQVGISFDYDYLGGLGIMEYRDIMDLYFDIDNVYKNSTYYKHLIKNTRAKWYEYTPDFSEYDSINLHERREGLRQSYPIVGITENYEWIKSLANKVDGKSSDDADAIKTGNRFMQQFHKFVNRMNGLVQTPEKYLSDDNYVPSEMFLGSIDYYKDKLLSFRDGNCCDKEEFIRWGGEAFLAYLNTLDSLLASETEYIRSVCSFIEPSINIPVVLVEEGDNLGADCGEMPGEDSGELIHSVGTWISGETYSELQKLRYDKISYDDYGNELDFVVTDAIGEDGEITYKVLSRYFVSNTANKRREGDKLFGDIIISIEDNEDGTAEFTYGIGVELAYNGSGYTFVESNAGTIFTENVPFEVKDVEFKYFGKNYTASVGVFDDAERKAVERHYDNGTDNMRLYKSFRCESNFGLLDEPLVKAQATLDRGSASAFELHSKLSEINTFEDLESYHNNEFGL